MKVATRRCRCTYCHDVIEVGQEISMVQVLRGTGSQVGAAKHVWRPAHPEGVPCIIEKLAAEEDRRRQAAFAEMDRMMVGQPEHVIAALRAGMIAQGWRPELS